MTNAGPVAVALRIGGGTLSTSNQLQALIDAIVGKSGSKVDDVPAALLALAAGGDPNAVAALVQAAVDALDLSGLVTPCPVDEDAVNALIVAALAALPAGAELQPLLDLLAVKPGATVADVAVIWQALSDGSVGFGQLLSLLSGKPSAANPTVADVQAGLPVLISAVTDTAIDASVNAGAIGAALSGLYSMLYNDEITPIKDAVRLGFPHVDGELAKKADKAVLQSFFNGVAGLPTGNATGAQASGTILNIKDLAESADKNSSTALDWALAVINAINGRIISDSPAVDHVAPAMDKIRADIAAAQASVDALAALGVGGGDGTGLTAEQAQMIVDTASTLAALITGIAGAGKGVNDAISTLAAIAGMGRQNARDINALQAENAALKARLDALEAKTQNLTVDGKLSTANVLGDGFVDSNGNAILPNLQLGLQLFVDVLTWGVEGGYGASGQTVETLYDALLAQNLTITSETEISTYLLSRDEWVDESLTGLATYVQEQVVELTAFSQGIIDAINGPGATLESTTNAFWLLNDILEALIAAAGIELPGKV